MLKVELTSSQLGLNSVWKPIMFDSYKQGNRVYLNCEIYTTAIIVANNTYRDVFNIPKELTAKKSCAANVIATKQDFSDSVACAASVRQNRLEVTIPASDRKYLMITVSWEI